MKKFLAAILIASTVTSFAGEPVTVTPAPETSPLKSSLLFNRKKMQANAEGESNIVIKMNLSQLAFKNLSFQAEYGFHKKLSFALGFSYLLGRRMPGFFYDEDPYFSAPSLNGFAVTPELRFYPGADDDKPAPRGFYLAPYFRYAKYSIKQTVSYQETPQSRLYEAEASHSYGGFNAGLMIGYQWIIADHFSIDLWIIGAGYGKAKYSYKWQANDANLTIAQQQDVKEAAEEYFDAFTLFGLDGSVETTPKSAELTVSGLPMYSLRFLGLNFGYAF